MQNARTISLQKNVAVEPLSFHVKWTKITPFVGFMTKHFVFLRKLYPSTLMFVQIRTRGSTACLNACQLAIRLVWTVKFDFI